MIEAYLDVPAEDNQKKVKTVKVDAGAIKKIIEESESDDELTSVSASTSCDDVSEMADKLAAIASYQDSDQPSGAPSITISTHYDPIEDYSAGNAAAGVGYLDESTPRIEVSSSEEDSDDEKEQRAEQMFKDKDQMETSALEILNTDITYGTSFLQVGNNVTHK